MASTVSLSKSFCHSSNSNSSDSEAAANDDERHKQQHVVMASNDDNNDNVNQQGCSSSRPTRMRGGVDDNMRNFARANGIRNLSPMGRSHTTKRRSSLLDHHNDNNGGAGDQSLMQLFWALKSAAVQEGAGNDSKTADTSDEESFQEDEDEEPEQEWLELNDLSSQIFHNSTSKVHYRASIHMLDGGCPFNGECPSDDDDEGDANDTKDSTNNNSMLKNWNKWTSSLPTRISNPNPNSNSNSKSKSSNKTKSNQTNNKQKLQFNPEIQVYYTIRLVDYTDDEYDLTFMKEGDLQDIIQKCRTIVDDMMATDANKKSKYCTRGLENLTEMGNDKKQYYKEEGYKAVLDYKYKYGDERSQEKEDEWDVDEDEDIAYLYAEASSRCRQQAVQRAKADAVAANKYLRGGSKLSTKKTKKSSRSRSPKNRRSRSPKRTNEKSLSSSSSPKKAA